MHRRFEDAKSYRKHPKHPKRMEMHNRTFKKLYTNLIKLAETVQKETVEGHSVFEWPAFNTWWHRREIKRMIEMLNLKPARFDGCPVGVRSRKTGTPHKQPWKIASNTEDMIKAFDGLLCSSDHEHEAIEGGKAASDSAFYPKE